MKKLDTAPELPPKNSKQKVPLWLGLIVMVAITLAMGFYMRTQSTKIPTSPTPSIVTGPKQSQPIARIAAVGDIACKPGMAVTASQCQMEAVAKDIAANNPDAVLVLGDLQYELGEPENFAKVFGTVWAALKDKSYAAPGNHEYGTKNAEGYFGYFNGAAESSKQAGERGKGYYSFNLDSWHVVALNSNCDAVGGCGVDSPQGKWLAADLSKYKASRCTLAFWHHPRFSSGRYKTAGYTPDFWTLLYGARADLVLNGHDHLYERFAKQRPDGTADATNGIRQFTIGTGGKTLYQFNQTLLPNHEFGSDNQFGYLTLRLYKTGYEWVYKTIDGNELDRGSSTCSN